MRVEDSWKNSHKFEECCEVDEVHGMLTNFI